MMGFLKIIYTKYADGTICGAYAADPVTGWGISLYSPAYGGLWVDGRQRLSHCEFYLTGQNANRRRKLREIATSAYNCYMETEGAYYDK